jgi:DNA-binding CsgD family transcriptional regulator
MWKNVKGPHPYYVDMVEQNTISERVEKLQNETVLSDRESEVFARMERGFTTGQIADELEISESSVESHKSNLRNRIEKVVSTIDNVNLKEPMTPVEFISRDMIEPEVMALLWAAIENEVPILIADEGTNFSFWNDEDSMTRVFKSGGKLLDSIVQFIPDDEPVASDTLNVLHPFEVRDIPKYKGKIDENRVVKHYPQDIDYSWLIDEYSNSGVYATIDANDTDNALRGVQTKAPRQFRNLTNSLVVSLNSGELSTGDDIIDGVSVVVGNNDVGSEYQNVVADDGGQWFMDNKQENLEEMGIYNDIDERVEYLEELGQNSSRFDAFASAMREWY